MLAETTTVRVTRDTRELLAEISTGRGITMAELLADLASREHERLLLQRMVKGFEEMSADEAATLDYRTEARRWEATVADGLG
jgi:hypothetical protein